MNNGNLSLFDNLVTVVIALMYIGFGIYILARPVHYGELTGIRIVEPVGYSEWRVAGAVYLMLGLTAAAAIWRQDMLFIYASMLFLIMGGLVIVRLISLLTGNMRSPEPVYAAFEIAFFAYAIYAIWSRGANLKTLFSQSI